MIITREIEIKILDINIEYYNNLGFEVYVGDVINIPIELLSKGSHYKILCKCDGCGCEKEVSFKNYLKYGNEFGVYYCRKCSENKRKKTLKENYGVEYPLQNIKILKKRINTIKKSKK